MMRAISVVLILSTLALAEEEVLLLDDGRSELRSDSCP